MSSIAVSGLGLIRSCGDVSRGATRGGLNCSPVSVAAAAEAAGAAAAISTRVIRPAAISTCRTCCSAPSNCTVSFAVPAGTRKSPSLAPSGLPSSVTWAPGGSVFT